MIITQPTVLAPGVTARPTSRGVVVVQLDIEADPVALSPEVLDGEHRRLGSRKLPDGTWKPSWQFRRDYLHDFDAQTGQPVFEHMDLQAPHLREPVCRMDLDEKGALIERDRGRLWVWMKPDAQPAQLPKGAASVVRAFGIGMDVGEGVGASDSTIEVMVGDTREQAAELADNRITPQELGRFGAAVARYYNEALVCCVRPMHGITVIRTMLDECHYYRLWHARAADKMVERRAEEIGWAKGEGSSDLLFDPWTNALATGGASLRSVRCRDQHREYIYDERGRRTLARFSQEPPEFRLRHGDMVVGAALAHKACCDLPLFEKVEPEPPNMYQLHEAQKRAKNAGVWT